MILGLEEVKKFLKLDGINEEDFYLETLMGAAEKYLENAGVKKDELNPLYKLAIMLLVGHWFENRNIVLIGTISKSLEFSLSTIITQLQYCGGDTV